MILLPEQQTSPLMSFSSSPSHIALSYFSLDSSSLWQFVSLPNLDKSVLISYCRRFFNLGCLMSSQGWHEIMHFWQEGHISNVVFLLITDFIVKISFTDIRLTKTENFRAPEWLSRTRCQFRSWSQGCEIKPHIRLCARHGACLRFSL